MQCQELKDAVLGMLSDKGESRASIYAIGVIGNQRIPRLRVHNILITLNELFSDQPPWLQLRFASPILPQIVASSLPSAGF